MRISLPRLLWSLPLIATGFHGCAKVTNPGTTGEPHLVISQLLYHSNTDALEWLEIRNDGEAWAVVAGVKIDAVGYQFSATTPALAPHARLILTNNPALFNARYPGVAVAGTFDGHLADEGEAIQLDGAEGKDFATSYSPREPWPVGAATGASLVYKGGDPAAPTSWGASAFTGGKPGENATTATDKGIWIAEVRPADALGNGFVELASLASAPVDLAGWILTSGLESGTSDTLAANTVIAAHGRLVLRQSAGGGLGRLLPAKSGGELQLIERSAGSLTGNAHAMNWEVVPDGMSIGRIGAGDGGIALIAAPSPGDADATRALGQVTINEVCYDPDVGQAEFVELVNETDSVIHLGFAADTARSWSLAGTGKTFLSTDTIAARGRFVLVSNSITADAFRSQHQIAANVPVVTFSGKLDNSGETLELRRPALQVVTNSGTVKWQAIVEDAASWMPTAPWPIAAAGGGSCLQRTSHLLAGTTFEAWAAAAPTPGK